MQRVILPGFDPATLAATVGATCFARGVQYAQQRAVVHVQWDPPELALHGMVRGSTGEFYATAAYFSQFGDLPHEFERGECSCPVGLDCKHAVALILAATGYATVRAAPRPVPRPAAWQESLDSLLGPAQG